MSIRRPRRTDHAPPATGTLTLVAGGGSGPATRHGNDRRGQLVAPDHSRKGGERSERTDHLRPPVRHSSARPTHALLSGHAPPGARPTRVFAQLVDDATGIVLGNQITPIQVVLDGRTHTPPCHSRWWRSRRPRPRVSAPVGRHHGGVRATPSGWSRRLHPDPSVPTGGLAPHPPVAAGRREPLPGRPGSGWQCVQERPHGRIDGVRVGQVGRVGALVDRYHPGAAGQAGGECLGPGHGDGGVGRPVDHQGGNGDLAEPIGDVVSVSNVSPGRARRSGGTPSTA